MTCATDITMKEPKEKIGNLKEAYREREREKMEKLKERKFDE